MDKVVVRVPLESRDVEISPEIRPRLDADVAPSGDFHRVFEGIRIVREERLHLVRGFEVELRGLHPHTVLVVERLAGGDAEEDFVESAWPAFR